MVNWPTALGPVMKQQIMGGVCGRGKQLTL
jgi:hypothetical protein